MHGLRLFLWLPLFVTLAACPSAGKDADILVVTGDPSDPRSAVEMVWIGGEVVADVRGERGTDREEVRQW